MIEDYNIDNREPDAETTVTLEIPVERYDIKGEYDEDEPFFEARRYSIGPSDNYAIDGDLDSAVERALLALKYGLKTEIEEELGENDA